ncbi:hypothetical protein CHARACLAT_032825 [Characodon lateralis]|uniref:Ig-like domain-containing protein n=1 Tax=Characodon lateralis TaxID=208331 RepID=A0ABU7D2L8_9TELE|nr:hypothetical protein [Characodon lateralis]
MLTLLPVVFFVVVSAGQRNITAEPGEDVTLTCRAAENKPLIVVKWTRTDLGSDQYVLLYRDDQFDPEGQFPSFKNRVDLKDVKNGDVSLVLKNVTTDDTGRYECRVVQRGTDRRKKSILDSDLISTIDLKVQGKKDEQPEDGGKEDRRQEDGGERNGRNTTGLIAGLSVLGIVVVVVVLVLVLHRRQRPSSPEPNPPPATEAELEQITT